jgi:hypothetical protein
MSKDNIEQKQHLIDLMNMGKQEAIKQAYGEHYDKAKDYIDKNGWCYLFPTIKGELDFENTGRDNVCYRPKSLQGIENNNGWIKIESEADLPEENGTYFTIGKTSYKPFYRIDVFCGRLKNSFTDGNSCFTHYQPIQKPLKPLY